MNRVLKKNLLHLHLPENISDALRNIAVIVAPLLLGYKYAPELTTGIAVGVLIVSLTDLPGNRQRKIKTAWQSVAVAAIVSFVFNACLTSPVATGIVLCVFSFVLALWNGFGAYAGAVGMSGVAMMIFMLGFRPQQPVMFSAYMVIGAVWFHLVVLLQIYLSPFRSLTQELKDLLRLTADFLSARADCYDPAIPLETAYQETMKLHLRIMAKQDSVRQLLLTDRAAMRQASDDVQKLLSTAIMAIQLYEHFIATPSDHGQLREILKDSGALKHITSLIRQQAATLRVMSKQLSIGSAGYNFGESEGIELSLKATAVQSAPEQAVIINAVLKNAAAVRVLLLEMSTHHAGAVNPPNDQLQRFLPDSRTFRSTLASLLHWRSPVLRFSLRLTVMLTVAFCLVYALTNNHYNYWFLLTIMVVSRPRVAVTWQRNLERVVGTVAGLAVAYALLALVTSPAILLTIAAICLTVFYALNRTRYDISVFAITICAVLFASVYAGGTSGVLYARLLYTFAGCALAIAGIFVFPIWVKAELDVLAKATVAGNANLLNTVLNGENEINIKLARKEAHQNIARLFEGLQHAQYEPGVKHLAGLKRILLLNYRLNAVILSLVLFEDKMPDKVELSSAGNNLKQAELELVSQGVLSEVVNIKEVPAGMPLLQTLTFELLNAAKAYNVERLLKRSV